VPPELADAVYDTLARAPVMCFVCLLDLDLGRETEPEFFASEEDSYATALMFLAERFQHHLQGADDVRLIVIDSRHREHDARLRRFFSDLQAEGTPYMKLSRIVEGLSSAEPLFDRPAVRRPRRRDGRRRRARGRPGPRLPAHARRPRPRGRGSRPP
jgi:hypothetical protein